MIAPYYLLSVLKCRSPVCLGMTDSVSVLTLHSMGAKLKTAPAFIYLYIFLQASNPNREWFPQKETFIVKITEKQNPAALQPPVWLRAAHKQRFLL